MASKGSTETKEEQKKADEVLKPKEQSATKKTVKPWKVPEGFVRERELAQNYPDFLKEIASNPKLEFPIIFDEDGPVFLEPRSGKEIKPKKFLPRTEYLVNSFEFEYWFNPEYRFDLDGPPLKDPEKGLERGNLVALETEWNRQRMFRLQRCYRDQSLKKWPCGHPGVMIAVNDFGGLGGMYGILPNMYAGVNVKAIKTAIARRPLDVEIKMIMEKIGIPLAKSEFTGSEVDSVIELFRPVSNLHNFGQIIDDHFASGNRQVPCDTLIVELMKQVHRQHVAAISREEADARARQEVTG